MMSMMIMMHFMVFMTSMAMHRIRDMYGYMLMMSMMVSCQELGENSCRQERLQSGIAATVVVVSIGWRRTEDEDC